MQLEKRVGDKVQGEGWVETRDGREERGEGTDEGWKRRGR